MLRMPGGAASPSAIRQVPSASPSPIRSSAISFSSHANSIECQPKCNGGLWQRLPLHALGERTLGIIGLGNCGRAVARRAKAFGMKVISYTVDPVSQELLEDLQVRLASLETVLAERLRDIAPGLACG